MATAHQIRDLISETTTGTVRPRVPREVREEVCRYAARRRKEGACAGRPRASSTVSRTSTWETGASMRAGRTGGAQKTSGTCSSSDYPPVAVGL
jgi:hypothetical protein